MKRYRNIAKCRSTAPTSTLFVTIVIVGVLLVLPNIIAGEKPPNRKGKEQTVEPGRLVAATAVLKAAIPSQVVPEVREVPIQFEDPARTLKLKRQELPLRSVGGTPIEDPSARLFEIPQAPRAIETPLAPGLKIDFPGISYTNWVPPDPILAVGPNHVVVVVNSSWAIHDKSSGTQLFQTTLTNWFANVHTPTDPSDIEKGVPFDPKVIYDHVFGRWIILALARDITDSTSSYLVSASQTSDPDTSQGWWKWKLDATLNNSTPTNFWADYPGLGFNASDVYITSNQYTFGDVWQYAKLRILDKTELYTGNSTLTWYDFWDMKNSDGSRVFTLKPAHSLSSTDVEYLLNTKSGGWDSVTVWAVDPTVSPPTLTRHATIEVGNYYYPIQASQPGFPYSICTNDCRTQDVMWQNGYLYTAFCEWHNWRTKEVAAIRYLKIDTNANIAVENITYGADRIDYYFPAVYATSYERAVIVFNCSSDDVFAGTRYVGNFPADYASASLKEGEGIYTIGYSSKWGGYRWGDYSGIGRDESGSIWFCSEYATNSNTWGTWVGAVDVSVMTILTSFTATGHDSYIGIDWITASEIDNTGFNIHRSLGKNDPYTQLNKKLIPAKGDEHRGATYSFNDYDVTDGITYHYWLESIDMRGNSSIEGPISATAGFADEIPIPTAFRLTQNYPNPFNPSTEIKYDLPVGCRVRLEIYNVLGQNVTTLLDEYQEAGSKAVRWDVSSELPSGMYFYRLQAGSFVDMKKMVLIK